MKILLKDLFSKINILGLVDMAKNKNFSIIENIVLTLTFVIVFTYVLAPFYGILPISNVNSLAIMFAGLGSLDCFTKMGMCMPCTYSGLPLGSYMLGGIPFAFTSSIIQILFDINVLGSYNLAGMIFLFIGWLGTFLIVRHFGGTKFLALFGGFLFLIMPIVWGKNGYFTLMWAFASFPIYVWLDIWFFNTKKIIFGSIIIFLSKIGLIFFDPYVFVMAASFSLAIMSYNFILNLRLKPFKLKSFLRVSIIFFSLLSAYIFYKLYVPGGADYSVMPMDFFRGQGIDLVAFFNRGLNIFAVSSFWNVSITNAKLFYTDGESVYHVYIGLGLLLTIPLMIVFSKQIRPANWILLGVGLITLILSLGPSLKINDQRDPATITSKNIVFSDYMMPEEAATATMPHASIFKIPPFKFMRSVSRWLLPTVLALIISLMVLISYLWNYNRRGKVLSLLVILLIVFEYAPNFKHRAKIIEITTSQFNLFNSTALNQFQANITKDDLVLFIQREGIINEYLSRYLCTNLECHTYNVSGDKAAQMSQKLWPENIYKVASKPDMEKIKEVLNSKLVTVLVFPHFNMRWNSYTWPPSEETRNDYYDFANQFEINGEQYEFHSTQWFSFIRLKK